MPLLVPGDFRIYKFVVLTLSLSKGRALRFAGIPQDPSLHFVALRTTTSSVAQDVNSAHLKPKKA
jgi:hypothetical protein